MLSVSDDAGRAWSPPIVVNDDVRDAASGPDDFHPMVAVNNVGIVGVSWYDRREAPAALGWRARFAASVDGGETVVPSVPVSTSRMQLDEGDPITLYPRVTQGAGVGTGRGTVSIRVGLENHPLSGGETTLPTPAGGLSTPNPNYKGCLTSTKAA